MAWRVALVGLTALSGCSNTTAAPSGTMDATCAQVNQGFGPKGATAVRAELVVSGLTVPWGLGFLPDGSMLLTERPGRLRRVVGGQLVAAPLATLTPQAQGESGLLGLAVDPGFAQNRRVYLYVSGAGPGGTVNRVERWVLSEDLGTASKDATLVDGIEGAQFHDGGRLRFGPDGYLYVGTGDGRVPERSRELQSLSGKLLRVDTDGNAPADNPWPGNRAFIKGIRNTQGFDWLSGDELLITDHGPSGELPGRTGHDEVNVARKGDDLGWPTAWGCEAREGLITPRLTWVQAAPPGGAVLYQSDAIAEWKGSVLIATLASEHLHRVVLTADHRRVERHEVYFEGELGRLRDLVVGPDGALYITTSNCDGRGTCPPQKDSVLRIVP